MIDENAPMWCSEKEFNTTVKNIGLNNYECHTIYSYVEFPSTSAIYISSNKEHWINYRDAFAFFVIRCLFVYEGWIDSNQEISSQSIWEKDNHEWINNIDIMGAVYCGSQIVNSLEPHKITTGRVNSETIQWFKANKATEQDVEFISNEMQTSFFISLYRDSYFYDRLFFGETDTKYIFIRLQLNE